MGTYANSDSTSTPTTPPQPEAEVTASLNQGTSGQIVAANELPALITTTEAQKTEESDWHKHIATWIAVITLALTSLFNYFGFNGLQTQIRLQQESLQQAQPVDFDVEARRLAAGDAQFAVRNLSNVRIIKVRAEFKYYFLFPDGQVKSRQTLQKYLHEEVASLNACRASNLIVQPDDVVSLLGTSRQFSTQYMVSDEVFTPEISQSSILNAVRLAAAINSKVAMRWRFDYQHQASRQRFTTFLYALVQPTKAARIIEIRPEDIVDLSRTVGGRAIIDSIQKHEENSREIIFPSQ
jgi:hypothetical protein